MKYKLRTSYFKNNLNKALPRFKSGNYCPPPNRKGGDGGAKRRTFFSTNVTVTNDIRSSIVGIC